jgi:hypothetical protein
MEGDSGAGDLGEFVVGESIVLVGVFYLGPGWVPVTD